MMNAIRVFAAVLCGLVPLCGATIVTGCVTDVNGKAVPGAKVFAALEGELKTYRAEARKGDGCYEMHIAKDGSYLVGVRDNRFASDGPIQRHITISGLDIPNVDLSTTVPDGKLLGERVGDAVLSASTGFSPLRRGVGGGDVPIVKAEIPSGFSSCALQSSNDVQDPIVMWWCSTGGGYGGIRDERAAHAMFETIRDSITGTLAKAEQLKYSSLKSPGELCQNCVDQAMWASPINGIVALQQSKVKNRNSLVLWVAYSSQMTQEGCATIRRDEPASVDYAKYRAAVAAMREEYYRQLNAALKSALRSLVLPGQSPQQAGVVGTSSVSPNACLAQPKPGAK